MNKKIALVVASEGYQPIEYEVSKKVLEEAGFEVTTVSDVEGTVTASDGTTTTATVSLKKFDVGSVQGVFYIGGPGALTYLDNQETNRILNEAMIMGLPYGAICIAPRILAQAHVLIGKKATGWNGDGKLPQLFAENTVEYVQKYVVVDGNIVTADGPGSAQTFGEAIVTVFSIKNHQ